MHTAFYADKVRDFGEINKDESSWGEQEVGTRRRADRSFADEFRPDEFKDEYA